MGKKMRAKHVWSVWSVSGIQSIKASIPVPIASKHTAMHDHAATQMKGRATMPAAILFCILAGCGHCLGRLVLDITRIIASNCWVGCMRTAVQLPLPYNSDGRCHRHRVGHHLQAAMNADGSTQYVECLHIPCPGWTMCRCCRADTRKQCLQLFLMFKMTYLQSLLGLQAETRHAPRISGFPQLRQAYYKEGPSGVWRPPVVNETCCMRARLAELLDEVAVSGPDVLYNGSYTKV